MVAILLQARGTGLSGTFGGDSAVYRSRRGIERRLWQFTIVLIGPLRPLLAGELLFLDVDRDDDRLTPRAPAPARPLHSAIARNRCR